MKKSMKPVVIAAAIGLMVLLMGCAIVALSLQDLKIGDMVILSRGEKREVISLQGYANSPGMLAAQEWFEFEESYDPDHKLVTEAEQSGFQAPAEYDAYSAYTQEMVDKIDEIAEKYSLKLAGEIAIVQNWQWELFFDALGMDGLVRQDAPVETEYRSGYFYACGNFSFDFRISLNGENNWPRPVLVSMRYNDKEYLDVIYSTLKSIEDCEQWIYRTEDGMDVLIAMTDTQGRIYCDREDAFLSAGFDLYHEWDSGEVEYMTKETVEQIVNAIDFTIKPQKPDMEKAKREIAEEEEKYLQVQANQPVHTDEEIYRSYIRGRLDALEHPENLYYTKLDINSDGTVDLLVGSKEKLEMIWTVMDDANDGTRHITFLPQEEVDFDEMAETWPDLEIYPITTYPME